MSDIDADKYVDPDPIVIVSTLISATALILQFVQVRNDLRDKAARSTSNPSNEIQQLDGLESAVDDLNNRLRSLERTIERASPDIDAELYDGKFGIGRSHLNIEVSQYQTYNNTMSYFLNNVSQMSSWINNIIANDARLAVRLGDKLSIPLSETAKRINSAITSGGTNGAIISEAKHALSALAEALHEELRRKGN